MCILNQYVSKNTWSYDCNVDCYDANVISIIIISEKCKVTNWGGGGGGGVNSNVRKV